MLLELAKRSLLASSLRRMYTTHAAPTFTPFQLALIQLGQTGSDKTLNLKHARDMIRRAAKGDKDHPKVDLVVLPVSNMIVSRQ